MSWSGSEPEGDDREATGDRRRALAPLLLLLAVALHQIHLTHVAALTPWKGGGFGMFATTDGLAERRVRAVVIAPGRSEEIEIGPRLRKLAARAAALPAPGRLAPLARAIVRQERSSGRPVDEVRIEVHGTDYAPTTLFATDRLLATHRWIVADDG